MQNSKTFREHVAEFDFQGLVLLLAGVICLLLGFNQSETSCGLNFHFNVYSLASIIPGQSPATISLLTVGGAVLIMAALWESFTKRSPIIPPRLFRVCQVSNLPRNLIWLTALPDTNDGDDISYSLLACLRILRR